MRSHSLSKTLSELATFQVDIPNHSTTKHCRYVVGTLDLMVAENYVIVYLCAMAQRDKLPTIGWLRECYTTVDRRLVLFTQIGFGLRSYFRKLYATVSNKTIQKYLNSKVSHVSGVYKS